jgi:nicotinamidase-related amidase
MTQKSGSVFATVFPCAARWETQSNRLAPSERIEGHRLKQTGNNRDRLSHAPDKSEAALLLIDVINGLEFDGGEKLLTHALPMAAAIAALKQRVKAAGIPAIYTNDNFGRWRSDFPKLVEQFLTADVRGRPVVARLAPETDDYFVLKPKHSSFFQTNLDILLKYLGVTTLILTGMAGDICVLFSANDAYMRDFEIFVPADCIACEEAEYNRQVLGLMQRVLKANVAPSNELEFENTRVIPPRSNTQRSRRGFDRK